MRARRGALCLVQAVLIFSIAPVALAQQKPAPEVRRAQPAEDPPTPKAVPFDTPAASPKPRRSPEVNAPPKPKEEANTEGLAPEPEASDRRQLDYANGLFSRKLYDLAAPEYEKFLG